MKTVLIVNGSPSGNKGNCQQLIKYIQKSFNRSFKIKVVHLAQVKSYKSILAEFEKCDGALFVTGTYWDSWGSPLQKLLEEMTVLEGSPSVVGKPCGVFVLMHSVGGKGILSRLQGVLSTMGFLIPPMSGMVYSLVSDLALKGQASVHKDDLWELGDVSRVLENFKLSLDIKVQWKVWPVDRKNFRKTWLK